MVTMEECKNDKTINLSSKPGRYCKKKKEEENLPRIILLIFYANDGKACIFTCSFCVPGDLPS